MAKQSPSRVTRVPQRTCITCREVQAKGLLVRVVRTQHGVFPDPTGKAAGRGAYVHARPECWQKGINVQLAHALRAQITEEDRKRLSAYFETLPQS